MPVSGVAEVSAKGRAEASLPRAVRATYAGRGLAALLASALLTGCGYTEFEWQAQLDRSERLQRELVASQARVRQLEEQGPRGGARPIRTGRTIRSRASTSGWARRHRAASRPARRQSATATS